MNDYEPLDTAPLPDSEAGFPWPPAEQDSIIAAFGDTWRGASLNPAGFFRALPEGGLGPAVLYYLVIGIAVAGASLFWEVVADGAFGGGLMERLGVPQEEEPNLVMGFLLSPLMLLISLILAAGVTHLMLKIFGGANRRAGTTVSVFAYAYSPQILGVIPWVGAVIGGIWMVVVAIIGLREAHGTSTAKAALAVLIPLTIALFFVFVSMLFLATSAVLMA